MPKLEIDSKPVEVPAGTNLIEAAKLLNIRIPHYCYHPGLTTVGSCRMCQVEVELNGRKSVVIGCNTLATDGMKIITNSEAIQKIRSSVLEFYLANHPLDCPICDDAGECDLQNYYMEHGLHNSRVELTEKYHKHKTYDVGPTVVLDSERCVLCSRCVRFCREIIGVDELGIFDHGTQSELLNVPGKQLENEYAGNVVDLCPVGALTDKDFRFKRRVWYLKRTPSICTGCSRGCNIFIDWDMERSYKESSRRIQRLKPRYNQMVNEWWMCDRGRYGYHHVDAPNRLAMPRTKFETNGSDLVSIEQILDRAAERIKTAISKHGVKSIGILASARSSNEDLFLMKTLFMDHLKIQNIDLMLEMEAKGKEDEILMKADLTPNRRSGLEIGIKPGGGSGMNGVEMLEAALEGDFEVLIIVRHDLAALLSQSKLQKLVKNCPYILYLGAHERLTAEIAHDVLPIAMWAERECTYTNFQGRIQRTAKPFEPMGEAIPEWEIWKTLAQRLDIEMNYQSVQEVFNSIGASISAFKGITWDGLGKNGQMLLGVTEQPYRKVQTAHPLQAY